MTDSFYGIGGMQSYGNRFARFRQQSTVRIGGTDVCQRNDSPWTDQRKTDAPVRTLGKGFERMLLYKTQYSEAACFYRTFLLSEIPVCRSLPFVFTSPKGAKKRPRFPVRLLWRLGFDAFGIFDLFCGCSAALPIEESSALYHNLSAVSRVKAKKVDIFTLSCSSCRPRQRRDV